MTSRLHKSGANTGELSSGAEKPSVVNLDDARRASSRRGSLTPKDIERELDEARELLDRGMPTAASARLRPIVNARHTPKIHASARCLLSTALEVLGRYHESLEIASLYESAEACKPLDPETLTSVRVRLGLAYNYAGDAPKAVAILNAELRTITSRGGTDAQLGDIYAALARVYRSINEFSIARDHSNKALEHYRHTGDWRGLAEGYFGLALADIHEGRHELGLQSFEQAIKLIGDHPAPHLLGRIYNNMAGAYWLLKRPHDGIRVLEKGAQFCENTEHKDNAVNIYVNLAINLMLIGEWDRAHDSLKHALSLAMELDQHGKHAAMAFDSIGELSLLRGDLDQALSYLERAHSLAEQESNKWYVLQVVRTMTRLKIAMGRINEAIESGEHAMTLAERIGDRQAGCESSLLLAEARLRNGEPELCAALLQKVSAGIAESSIDIAVTAELQRVSGMLALEKRDSSLAVHHFSRSVSIFEMLGDRYRTARARAYLGRAYALSQPSRAVEQLGLAAHAFRTLGAKLDLEQTERLLAEIESRAPEEQAEPPAQVQLLTLRLAEAAASRELLLRELAAVLHQETHARRVVVAEAGEGEQQANVVIAHGCANDEAARLAAPILAAKTDDERQRAASESDCHYVLLRPSSAAPAIVIISPREMTSLTGGGSLEPLLRVVELGMDVCALRTRARAGADAQAADSLAGASLMPGFIHSSPAMTQLVDEVHKIRSSDVTVLVTGESGTGKELVARAIHALSSRRNKVFVPFNCTAVPKELSEGYLFGYRRGAFTGAVSDSPGVIRTAAGGTLFLDEVGDLPLDVQPKLLRFLQEGEIQPLGEQRPIKVDVRIIAATNTDLEGMVADGRFREDLYYRLNVIRLRVPPLRERRSEIPTIVNYYINHYSAKFGRRDITITPPALDLLTVCDWPGNVRQLCNEVQRIVARADDGTVIMPEHISSDLRRVVETVTPVSTLSFPGSHLAAGAAAEAISQGLTLADAMAELERRMIAEALRKHNGNISRAARELGLTRRGLYLKLDRHDLSASA